MQALCLVEVPLTLSSVFARCRTSPSLLKRYSRLPSSTLIKPSILWQGRSYGGGQEVLGSRNGLSVSSKECTPMPGVMGRSMVNTVRSLAWELGCIRALSLAHCCSSWLCFYQTRLAWSVDQGSNKNHSPAYNFTPTVTKFCVMWEGLSLPHDIKFGNCRCKIVDSRSFHSWSLIHGLRWSGLIKVGPGVGSAFARVPHCYVIGASRRWWPGAHRGH